MLLYEILNIMDKELILLIDYPPPGIRRPGHQIIVPGGKCLNEVFIRRPGKGAEGIVNRFGRVDGFSVEIAHPPIQRAKRHASAYYRCLSFRSPVGAL